MQILCAFDATGCAHSAAVSAEVGPTTVRRYVARWEAGVPVDEPVRRPSIIDGSRPTIAEAAKVSESKVLAEVDEISDYLAILDAKVDDVLRSQDARCLEPVARLTADPV